MTERKHSGASRVKLPRISKALFQCNLLQVTALFKTSCLHMWEKKNRSLTPISLSNTSMTMVGGLTAISLTSPHRIKSLKTSIWSQVGLLVSQITRVSATRCVKITRPKASVIKTRSCHENCTITTFISLWLRTEITSLWFTESRPIYRQFLICTAVQINGLPLANFLSH